MPSVGLCHAKARKGVRVTHVRRLALDVDDDGSALAAARTHRRNTDAATPLQFVDERRHHPRARRRDGMA